MAIFDQASLTNLRGLKYGNDLAGGGNSGEPYITQPIPPALQEQVESTTIWNSDNGLIRGGFAGATRASATDLVRIGKFFKDTPRGPLFVAKQVGLQLSNPKLENKRSAANGIEGFLESAANLVTGAIGSNRVYNLGINTLLQTGITAFGGHIVRHGLLPILSDSEKYEAVAINNDARGTSGVNNRLVRLKEKLSNNLNTNISTYIGGPGSIDGIGLTIIKRYNFTLNNSQYIPLKSPVTIDNDGIISNLESLKANVLHPTPNPNYYNAQGVSLQYFDNDPGTIAAKNSIFLPSDDKTNNLTENSQIGQNAINYGASRNYTALRKALFEQTNSDQIGTATINKYNANDIAPGTINNFNTVSAPIVFNITGKSKYKSLDLSKYNIDRRLGLSQADGYKDEVNLTPLYYSSEAPGLSYINIPGKGRPTKVRDLIKFRIEAVDNDSPNNSVWMIFRSYLKDISDNPNPSWNTVNYVGRGEPFYIYKGFERNISFTLQVAAMSEAELKPMWQKLNYLYSNTMPDYSSNNVMRAPYMKLTLGDYMYRQPGVIKNLTYTIGNDSPWEIAIDDSDELYELPHVMTIQMTFAPIHDFVPRKFPSQLNQIKDDGNLVPDWGNLPAFVVDRQSNENAWLQGIFDDTSLKIPVGTDSEGIPQIYRPTPELVRVTTGAADINNINVPLNIPTPTFNP
jgi:hypothetical protein